MHLRQTQSKCDVYSIIKITHTLTHSQTLLKVTCRLILHPMCVRVILRYFI